jgi:hypothetical protein
MLTFSVATDHRPTEKVDSAEFIPLRIAFGRHLAELNAKGARLVDHTALPVNTPLSSAQIFEMNVEVYKDIEKADIIEGQMRSVVISP